MKVPPGGRGLKRGPPWGSGNRRTGNRPRHPGSPLKFSIDTYIWEKASFGGFQTIEFWGLFFLVFFEIQHETSTWGVLSCEG